MIKAWGYDRTAAGDMLYDWGYSGPDGAWFTLIRENRHTDADVAAAEAELRADRDVTSLRVGRYYGRDGRPTLDNT